METPAAGGTAARIRAKLEAALAPESLEIRDESHLHAGHAGARPGGESHFAVTIVAAAFAGRDRISRHRLVHAALAEELRAQVHALKLRTLAPGETPRG